jgi:hypothetical protein
VARSTVSTAHSAAETAAETSAILPEALHDARKIATLVANGGHVCLGEMLDNLHACGVCELAKRRQDLVVHLLCCYLKGTKMSMLCYLCHAIRLLFVACYMIRKGVT